MSNKEALGNAIMFDAAYTLLHNEMQSGAKTNDMKKLSLIVPVAVNCAFSCELFMKAMLPDGVRGHELKPLFDKLDPGLATKIADEAVRQLQAVDPNYSRTDFDNDLVTNSSAFDHWRYFHEGRNSPTFNMKFMYFFQLCLKGFATVFGQ